MISLLSQIGRWSLEWFSEMGKMFLFLISALVWVFRPPAKISLIVQHIKSIGVDSLLVVIMSGFFTGMVMGLQGY